jgi:hypothetical protein
MRRIILGVLAGVLAWWALAFAGGVALRLAWPAYAAVEQSMAFDLPMKAARLALGALATLGAGWLTGRLAVPSRYAPLILGLVMLAAFVPIHVSLWDRFPVWYHLTFLGSLPTLSALGGALGRAAGLPGQPDPAI